MSTQAGLHEEIDGASLDVTAFRHEDGWRFRLDVYERQDEGTIHTEAVGSMTFPTESFALAQGMAYAHWLVGDQDEDPPADVHDQLAEVRRHTPADGS
jgi:hypothetical protein